MVFSAAKLFFAYGLGNSMSFPVRGRRDRGADGRTADASERHETPARPQPDHLLRRPDALWRHAGGSRMRARERLQEPQALHLRRRSAAGGHRPALAGAVRRGDPGRHRIDRAAPHLPEQPGRQGAAQLVRPAGAGIHPSHCRRGRRRCSGRRDRRTDRRRPVGGGRILEPAREIPQHLRRASWTWTGDKYIRDEDGYYQCCGRSDDMFKVSGIWVSPFEVEAALLSHDSVFEAAVVPHPTTRICSSPRPMSCSCEGTVYDDALLRRAEGTRQIPDRRLEVPPLDRAARRVCPKPRPARFSASCWSRNSPPRDAFTGKADRLVRYPLFCRAERINL